METEGIQQQPQAQPVKSGVTPMVGIGIVIVIAIVIIAYYILGVQHYPNTSSGAINQTSTTSGSQSKTTMANQSQISAVSNMSNLSSASLTTVLGGFWNDQRHLGINTFTASAMGYQLNASPNVLFYRYQSNWSSANMSQEIQQFGYKGAVRFSYYQYYNAPFHYLFNGAYTFGSTAIATQTYGQLVSQTEAVQDTNATSGTYEGVSYTYSETRQANSNILIRSMLAHSGPYIGIIVEETNISRNNSDLTEQDAQKLLGYMISS